MRYENPYSLIKHRFRRAMPTYEEAAVVQARLARRLVEALVEQGPFERVFEIGVGTGLFTRMFVKEASFRQYLGCDLVWECGSWVQPLGVKFLVANAEDPSWLRGSFDLVVANAVLQWFLDPARSLALWAKKVSSEGILAFTVFGPETMKEIPHFLPPGMAPRKIWEALRPSGFKSLHQASFQDKLYFPDFKAALRHVRETGALGTLNPCWSFKELRALQKEFERYRTPKGYPLTFESYLFLWRRED